MTRFRQYIRFGRIPEDKISKIHRSDAILAEEKGVSVWNCAFVNGVPFPLLPSNTSEAGMADYFYMLFSDKPVYLVTGTELEERGHANEPLLGKDIEIIEEYTDDYAYLKKIHQLKKRGSIKNKEALKWLKSFRGRYGVKELEDAVDVAIKLLEQLEQNPCDDAISRADVLDLCDSKDAEYKVKHFREDVECLPSVYPKQKSGHWIVDNEYVDIRKMYHYSVHCSNCGFRGDYSTDEEGSAMSNFCPNCSAKMVESEKA